MQVMTSRLSCFAVITTYNRLMIWTYGKRRRLSRKCGRTTFMREVHQTTKGQLLMLVKGG